MKILAHRGQWNTVEEKNTLTAIGRAFENGFGIETDIRDYEGRLVISHNIADASCVPFAEALKLYAAAEHPGPMAVNIKADGLQDLLAADLAACGAAPDYFVFDMSIPEQVVFCNRQVPFFARMSEIEQQPVQQQLACGIWMDEWTESWITADIVEEALKAGKRVSIISPEIHGRDKTALWKALYTLKQYDMLLLCTDLAAEAAEYFNH